MKLGICHHVFSLVVAAGAGAAPVINEIMYRPGSTYPENPSLEFIEIFNPDSVAVDLSGWAFTSGVGFTFPAGTLIEAGSYLVVAGDPPVLSAATGLSGLLGPWTSGANLSDKGEKIVLSAPDGAGGWTIVDKIEYADEGDWAIRTRDALGGWSWITQANGGGCSVERQSPALRVNSGQNWAASAVVGGTPSAANTVLTTNVPPVISGVRHFPPVPTSSDPVTVWCRLTDERPAASLSATLRWRDATGVSPGAFNTLQMTGDGTGQFAATLDPKQHRTIIEFYISATDGTLTRTWPAPTSEGQNANCTYQVDNEVIAGVAPVYRLVLTAAENAAFELLAATRPQSNRRFNVTLVVTRGDDTTTRYLASMRIRGSGSRNYVIKPLRISLPSDSRWDGISDFMINTRGAPVQHLAHRIQRAAGLVAADTSGIELRRQGIESTVSSGNSADFGQVVRLEELDGDYVDHHWPEAVCGQAYKKEYVTSWASTGAVPSTPDAYWSGWSKQNRHALNDWSDVGNFCTTWQTVAFPHFNGAAVGNVAAGTWNNVAFSDAEVATLSAVADLDYLARWLAVMTILPNNEPNLSTGEDGDYAAAFISNGATTRFYPLPHDMDSTFGLGDAACSYDISGLYDSTEEDTAAQIATRRIRPVSQMKPLQPLLGTGAMAGNAAFRAKYLLAIRELFGSVFDADTSTNPYPAFHQFVDNHIGWVPVATRTAIKTFMANRQAYLLGLIGAPKIAPPEPTNTGGTHMAEPAGSLRLSEILALNTATYFQSGAYPDLIELHNAGGASVNLSGYTLADDEAHTYTFPGGSTIPAGGFLLLTSFTLGFGLDTDGDSVTLADPSGAVLDRIVYGPQLADRSISRLSTDPGTWGLTTPTPATANGPALPLGSPATLRINEWAGNTDFRLPGDFVEIHNPTDSTVSLGGMAITDDLLNYPARYTFPALSFIDPGGFAIVWAETMCFALDGQFEQIWFTGANGAVVDQVDLISQYADHSTGRLPDGSTAGPWADFALPTPRLANLTPVGGHSDLLAYLRITELMYAPTGGNDYEYIELQNVGDTNTLDLSGVRFTQGVDYVFPAGTTLPPRAFIVVCKDRAAYLSRYTTAEAVGALAPNQYTSSLDNSGETLALTLPFPWLINIHTFDYDAGWYPQTAGGGHSLTTRSQSTTAPRLWNDSATWSASALPSGTPGADEPPVITSAAAASGIRGDPFSYLISATKAATSFAATGLPPGLSVNTANGLISGTPVNAGTYSIMLSASNAWAAASAPLTLTVNAHGELDHFTWNYIPMAAIAGERFAIHLTARDAGERVVENFLGAASLSSVAVSQTVGSPILITEVGDESEDQFELQNVSSATVPTAGWFVIIGDSSSDVSARNAAMYSLPASMASRALLRVSESSATGRVYFGGAINWSGTSTSKGWVMLFDNTSTLRDFVAFGWSASDLANLSLILDETAVAPVILGLWAGPGLSTGYRGSTNSDSWRRIGGEETNAAADWAWSQNAASFGSANPGLTLPWMTTVPLTLTPGNASLAGGQFLGYVRIADVADNARLDAEDGSGRSGSSQSFDVIDGTDSDGDSMPDAWENAHGLASGDPSDASLDPDKDGQSNLAEYACGTDPRDPSSRLAVAAWALVPGSGHLLSWAAQSGKLYTVCTSTNLVAWTPIASVLATTDGNLSFSVPGSDAPRLFVRVEIAP